MSEDFTVLTFIKKIAPDEIKQPNCCYQFFQDSLMVTCVPNRFNNGSASLKFVTVDNETKVNFSFSDIDYSFDFPFGICESLEYYKCIRL